MTRKSETARQRYLQEQPADGPEAPPAAGPGPADPLADLETGANLPVEEVFTPFPKRAAGIEAEPEIQPASATQPIKVRGAARPKAKPARRWMAIGLIGLAGMTLLAGSLLIGLMLRFSPGFAARVTAIFTPTPQMAVAFASGKGRAATVTTDVDGKASLADPVTQQPVEVSVRAGESGMPLSNIEVNYLSDGVQVLVIAVDPSGQRAPVVVQPEPQTDVTQPRVIVIDMRLLSSFGTAQEIMDYYLNQYPLQSWNWGVEDTCLTGEELADRLNPEKARGMYFIPLIGAGTPASDPEQAQGMLQFLRSVIQQTGVSDMGLPGVLRLRFYRLAPLPLTLLEWQGFCPTTNNGQIAYVGLDYNIYIYQPDSGKTIQVTFDGSQTAVYSEPQFSPDGHYLAYLITQGAATQSEKSAIFISDVTAMTSRKLVDDGGGGFDWSPDGQNIAYSRSFYLNCASIIYEGITNFQPQSSQFGIWNIEVATGNKSELIKIDQPDKLFSGSASPQWSPDGQKMLVYKYFCSTEPEYHYVLWNGSPGLIDLGVNQHVPVSADWMPDSSSIIGSDFKFIPPTIPPAGLYVYGLDGQVLRTLFFDQNLIIGYPLVSPDEKFIAFMASPVSSELEQRNIDRLSIVSMDGSGYSSIYGNNATPLAWSPDGKQILFIEYDSTTHDSTGDLFIYHSNKSPVLEIASGRVAPGDADWAPLP